jgi:GT2 family glycosyltransferase
LLGPSGNCALYTANLLRQVYSASGEYFDEQFFCYAEDTDLAWRAVLLGYQAAYAADARVYHKVSIASGGPGSDFVLYHGIRNSL